MKQQQLLHKMKGVEGIDLKDVTGKEQMVKEQLGNFLRGKKCLLVLDDVRSHEVVSAFNFDGFEGSLLVTGLSCEAWPTAPKEVEITPKQVEAPLDGAGGRSLAWRLLVSTATNNVDADNVLGGCQVGDDQLCHTMLGITQAMSVCCAVATEVCPQLPGLYVWFPAH
jgi:hypothetical protein